MKISKSQKIRKLITAIPEISTDEVIRQTKATRQQVYCVRWALKKDGIVGTDMVSSPKPVMAVADEIAVFTSNRFTSNRAVPKTTHKVEPKAEQVDHPNHYTKGGIETIDFIKAKLTPEEYKGFLKGNLIKYLSRAGLKGEEANDYGKIRFYSNELERLGD